MPVTSFSVDSDLLLELGERLVANKATALAELVKNSYDADDVTIQFIDIKKPGGTIIVKDTGNGMNFQTVNHNWMRIATNVKKREILSKKYKRIVTGSKGIGRFACRVLSNVLILETIGETKSQRKYKTKVTIDWKKYTSGSDLSKIKLPYELVRISNSTDTETIIMLKNCREAWQDSDINDLKKHLITLISPFPKDPDNVKNKGDPGFQIIVNAPEFNIQGPLEKEDFLKYHFGRLEGVIKDAETFTPEYTFNFRLDNEEPLTYPSKKKFPNLKLCNFRIDFFVYRGEFFKNIPIGVTDARKRGKAQGGIRIYLDNFRIFPYGDLGDDWLSLDERRGRRVTEFMHYDEPDLDDLNRPALALPGNNQVFGVVNLSRINNPNIEVAITREKLLENIAFEELKEFIQTGIEWMTVQYARWRSERQEKSKADPIRPIRTAKRAIQKNERLDPGLKNELIQHLDGAIAAVEHIRREQITETSMLRVLASTGTMITIFQHEISLMINDIKNQNTKLKKLVRKVSKPEKGQINKVIKNIDIWVDMTENYARQIGILVGEESRDVRKKISLYFVINQIDKVFKEYWSGYKIDFNNDVKKNVFLPDMYNCEIYAIFLNVITNAIKAVKKTEKRMIEVYAHSRKNKVLIKILDTGSGVSEDRREEVFKPFVSDSEADPIFGQGTGLGLTIVKNIVETYGGSVKFVDPPKTWETCLEMVFERE